MADIRKNFSAWDFADPDSERNAALASVRKESAAEKRLRLFCDDPVKALATIPKRVTTENDRLLMMLGSGIRTPTLAVVYDEETSTVDITVEDDGGDRMLDAWLGIPYDPVAWSRITSLEPSAIVGIDLRKVREHTSRPSRARIARLDREAREKAEDDRVGVWLAVVGGAAIPGYTSRGEARRAIAAAGEGRAVPGPGDASIRAEPPRIVDDDQTEGVLYYDRGVMMLFVKCPSKGETTIIEVPPHFTSAKAARAWTFGLDPESFTPKVET